MEKLNQTQRAEFLNRHRTVILKINNNTDKDMKFEEKYFWKGCWFATPAPITTPVQTKGVPLDIAAHSVSIGYAAAMPTSSFRGVAAVLVYSLKTNPQLVLHIGFTNPHSG